MTTRQAKLLALGAGVLCGTAGAAPRPFDTELAGTFPADEEVVMHSIASCSPFTTPGLRSCTHGELDLNGDGFTDLIVGVNQDSSDPADTTKTKRLYLGRGNGLFNSPVYFGLPNMATSALKIADLDNDADLDIVETVRANGLSDATSDVNTVYVNRDGTLESLLANGQPLDSTHYRSSSVAVGDVNNDGKLDKIGRASCRERV